MEQDQSKFEGWAIVDVLGHQRYAGYVRTESYGAAVLFRVDVPEIREKDLVLEVPEYVQGDWTPAGAKVKRAASPGFTKLIGAGSIYSITPCSEEAAMKAVELAQRPEMKLVELPAPALVKVIGDPVRQLTKPPTIDSLTEEEEDSDDESDDEILF